MREIKKNCLHCGSEFVKTGRSQKYCPTCGRIRSKKVRKYEKLETTTCRECGKEFKPTHYISVYCSKECSKAWHRANINRLRRESREARCIVCGELITDVKRRKYCSEECKKNNRVKFYQPKDNARNTAKHTASLSEISAKANEEGLTYGQYVAKYGL